MSVKYSEEQRKLRLYRAIKMRDEKVERVNRKTGKVEILSYDRDYIKKVSGITRYEAIHLGVFPKPKSKLEELKKAVAKALKSKKTTMKVSTHA